MFFLFCPVSFYYQKLPLSLFFLWQAMWWNFNVFFRFCHDVFWLIHTERHWLYSVNWEKKSLEMLYMRYSYWSVCVCYDTFIIVYCKMPIEFTHVLLINIHLRWCCPRSVCVCVCWYSPMWLKINKEKIIETFVKRFWLRVKMVTS